MDELLTLMGLSFAMLVGCYLSGSVPLAFTLSEEKLKLVSVLGAGLLVGTALSVIIPEGVHTMYSTQLEHHHHHDLEKSLDVQGKNEPVAASQVGHVHGHIHEHGTEIHSLIGVALVIGFIFMLLVDQLSGGGHMHSTSSHMDMEGGSHSPSGRRTFTATLGLVVHAAADGIALGAAAIASQTHVEMIVFVAIMLHKAPAAFGLVSFLLHEGLDRNTIRRHLAVFSAAAPVLAIFTYFGLSQQSKETLSQYNATGLAMLFSAGTFLYVATVHILPELSNMGTSRTVCADGTIVVKERKGFSKFELLLMVIGSCLPLILSLGHHH